MKRLLILTLIQLGLVMPSFAACNCTNSQPEATINVSATATKEVSPDTVEINIEIQTEDAKSMQAASKENSELSLKVLESMKQFLNTSNGDYVKTAYFRADSKYKYINNRQVFDCYQVTNTVVVHTKDISKISEIIEKAISEGATGVSNLNFSISNYDSFKNELISEAMKKAESQACTAAKTANSEILKIKTINISNNAYGHARNTVLNFKAARGSYDAAVAESATPSIEPGIIKIQADVNVIYYIK